MQNNEDYQNIFANIASKLLPNYESKTGVVTNTGNNARKKRSFSNVQKLMRDLEVALKDKQWFVTGDVDYSFFSDSFSFEDPDVKVQGIEEYSKGIKRIFNQNKSPQAEILSLSMDPTDSNLITVRWIIRVWVNIAWGIRIRPYIVETDFRIDPKTGLIISQRDRFTIPSYQILLPSLFPFLEPLFPKTF